MASPVPAIVDSVGLPDPEPAVVVLHYSSLALFGPDPDLDSYPFAGRIPPQGHGCRAPTLVAVRYISFPDFDLVYLFAHTSDTSIMVVVDLSLGMDRSLVYHTNPGSNAGFTSP